MRTLPTVAAKTFTSAALLAVILFGASACSERELALPLLVPSGPDNFTSFEMRTSTGDTIWRLEAETPSEVPFLVYAIVPDGFRQVFPKNGAPRPLRLGEDLVLESRIPDRVFLHRGFAQSRDTISVLEWEMRRLEPVLERASEPVSDKPGPVS